MRIRFSSRVMNTWTPIAMASATCSRSLRSPGLLGEAESIFRAASVSSFLICRSRFGSGSERGKATRCTRAMQAAVGRLQCGLVEPLREHPLLVSARPCRLPPDLAVTQQQELADPVLDPGVVADHRSPGPAQVPQVSSASVWTRIAPQPARIAEVAAPTPHRCRLFRRPGPARPIAGSLRRSCLY